MPTRPAKPCAHAGCHALVRGGPYCTAHAPQHARARYQADRARRGTFRERGYDTQWDKVSRAHRRAHPLCVICRAKGRVVRVRDVDHIVPFWGIDDPLRLDPDNLQSLCRACHNGKTAQWAAV